jgi:predicted  nucleic acid-binding Zn-ribbon protein
VETEMKKSFSAAKAENADLQQQLTALKGEKTALQQTLLALQRRIAELEILVGSSDDF